MNIVELINYLETLVKQGKGEFIVYDSGYMNEVEEKYIEINDKEKFISL